MNGEAEEALQAAVGRTLDRHVTVLGDVTREPLHYDAFLPHRAVSRLSGIADADGELIPWSLIEKRTEGPHAASPYLFANGRREFDAYASGVLDQLAPGIRAPRAHGMLLGPDGSVTLWLEEVHHDGPRPLDASSLLVAAHRLGGLAGNWLGRELDEPWYFTEWIARHAQPEAVDEGLGSLRRANADVVSRMGDRLALAERLIRGQSRVRRILESLPRTFCHHDAVGSNVFRSGERIVLIDWESAGPGPVGADLASLLFSSVRRGDAPAAVVASILEDAVRAYAEGLRATAGEVTQSDVRQGFDAAAALRWKLAVDVVAGLERGEVPRRGSLPQEPPEAAFADLLLLVDLLLESASRTLHE